MGYNPRTGECRLSSFDERDARITYHPTFNYYRRLMPAADSGPAQKRYYYQNYPGAYQPPPRRGGFSFPATQLSSSTERAVITEDERSVRGGSQSICNDYYSDSPVFRQVRSRTRLKSNHIQRSLIVASLYECERECLEESQFKCMSFNFMPQIQATLPANCDLSHRHFQPFDRINDPDVFEIAEDYDFYARESIDPCVDGKLFLSPTLYLCLLSIFLFSSSFPRMHRPRNDFHFENAAAI